MSTQRPDWTGATTRTLVTVVLAVLPITWSGPALAEVQRANGNLAIQIPSFVLVGEPDGSEPYVILECRGSTLSISFNWRQPVGKTGEKRRHLISPVGYKHLMLPVIGAGRTTTGYVRDSAKAKSLIHSMLRMPGDGISVEVFPAGRDPVTGDWIGMFISSKRFREAAMNVGKACEWDMTIPAPPNHDVDYIDPA
jgi:hypothetical protein